LPEQPTKDGLYTNGRRTTLPKNLCPKPGEKVDRKDDVRDKDGLGPGQYTIKYPKQMPTYTFGTRFDSQFRNKDHLRPRKVDGPGPGAYKLPSSVKTGSKSEDSLFRGTFGSAARGQMANNDGPAPNKYRPVQFTEASHCFSFPRAVENLDVLKDGSRIGPGEYKNMVGMGEAMNQAKGIPKGQRTAAEKANGFPGPDAYNINPPDNIPGFKMIKPETQSTKKVDKNAEPVGPQRYNPANPNHKKTDNLRG
jgi:hypothetical protein